MSPEQSVSLLFESPWLLLVRRVHYLAFGPAGRLALVSRAACRLSPPPRHSLPFTRSPA
jgi:hypothetical protein